MFSVDMCIEILEQTPKIVRGMLEDLSENWTVGGSRESWSPFDVVGHFIHGEKTDWIPRLDIILSDLDDKTFTPFDRFAQFEFTQGKTLSDLLDEFEILRAENITRLQEANVDDKLTWEGIHPELGKVNLQQLLATWVVHDLNHISQISKYMAKQFEAEVGPWRAYLSILN